MLHNYSPIRSWLTRSFMQLYAIFGAHKPHPTEWVTGRLSEWLRRKMTTTWWLMTSSNGNIFRVTGPLCGEFTGPGEFPTQRPVTRNFDVFFDLRLNKRLSKQSWGWWFETLSRPLWRHCNDMTETLCNTFLFRYAFSGEVLRSGLLYVSCVIKPPWTAQPASLH